MFEEEYDDYESIPAAVKHLYRKSGDKYVLMGPSEIKTSEDVSKLQESLRKERDDHKDTKKKLSRFGDMDADEVLEKLDRIEELEAAAGGKLDEDKINELADKRARAKIAPIERENKRLQDELTEANGSLNQFKEKDRTRSIHDVAREAANKLKVRPEAVDDILMYAERLFEVDEGGSILTKDGVGTTPGLSPELWLTELRTVKTHWFPESKGAGARGGDGGGGGTNPFSADGWNMTEQGRLYRENPEKATKLAQMAGTSIGGPRPEK